MSGAQGLHEHVLAAPMGFVSAIQLLERLCEAPKAVLHLARNVARYDEDNTGDMTAENYVEAFQAAGIAMNAAALGNASRALAYLYRGVKTTDTDAEAAAGVLGMSTSLSEDACYVVTQAIAKAMSEVAAGGEGEAAKPKKPVLNQPYSNPTLPSLYLHRAKTKPHPGHTLILHQLKIG
mmetsp:Transcript_14643/g.43985  ORF Transcript_14643/g.43985 Transcript_14643/m.43985 type:complete len:179 (-) Transcript_14643:6-542(-)